MDALTPAIYIMANESNDILYIGVTQDLIKRVWQHKNDIFPGFTRKYHVHRLVYYEFHEAFESAIMRGKQLKKWNRRKKIELIEKENPRWDELWEEIYRNDGL